MELSLIVLLATRITYQEDWETSPSEIHFGTPMRVTGKFFNRQGVPASIVRFSGNTFSPGEISHKISRHFVYTRLETHTQVFEAVPLR